MFLLFFLSVYVRTLCTMFLPQCCIYLLVNTNLMVALFTHSFTLGMIHIIHWIFVPFAKGSESPTMDEYQNHTLSTPQRFSVTEGPTMDNETESTTPDVRNTQNWANQVHLIMYHMDFNLLLARLTFRILHDAICFLAAWPWGWSTSCHWLKKQKHTKKCTFRALLFKTF